MNKKNFFVSIVAVVLIIGASFSCVLGATSKQSPTKSESPLFIMRTQRSIQNDNHQMVQTQYLGKGITTNLFFAEKPPLSAAIDRTIKMLQTHPVFFSKFIETLTSNPQVILLLQKNDVDIIELKTHLNRLKNDPSLFLDEVKAAKLKFQAIDPKTPLPLSLNTSNPLGCVITAIAMIPVVLVISLIVVVFTLRILQCLNFEEVVRQMFDQIMQELFPAGSMM